MALPKLNETLNFELTVPSTGQKVKYRPYLVKEEKVLLQAFESGDPKTCLEAMIDTITACLDERTKIDVGSLATFDVEYMFVKVRSKSVGENSDLVIACGECKHDNAVTVNLDEIEIDISDRDNVIPITENISVEMRYPTYEVLTKQDLSKIEKEDMDAAMAMIATSVAAILTEEERIETDGLSSEEVIDFISSMTTSQLKSLSEFMENMPALTHGVKFKCEACGHDNDMELKGLSDFF